MADQVHNFFADRRQWTGTERSVDQAVEAVRVRADWLLRDAHRMKLFLSQSSA